MQTAQNAKQQMRELANAGREQVAGQLDSVARALRNAGEQEPEASQYTRLAGDKVGALASYLRDRDAVDLVHDVEDFARSNPMVFLGGCAVAGFLIGRFFKASPVEEPQLELDSGYAQSSYESPYAPPSYQTPTYGTTPSAYDTRISSMPRTPALDQGSGVVAQPTIPTSDPWRPGGSGNGSQGG